MTTNHSPTIPWQDIDTVLLDMDGTLLDLHYDNYFWLKHMPLRFAEKHNISVEDAHNQLLDRYNAIRGTLNWYCIDYWSDELGMDIERLKREVHHLIAIHPHVIEFLDACRACGKTLALVTNAHQKVLAIKMQRTQLAGYFDHVLSSHDFGLPKEDRRFWDALKKTVHFDNTRTLFVDDSRPVLESARDYGIGHLLMITEPDSRQAATQLGSEVNQDPPEFLQAANFAHLGPNCAGA